MPQALAAVAVTVDAIADAAGVAGVAGAPLSSTTFFGINILNAAVTTTAAMAKSVGLQFVLRPAP